MSPGREHKLTPERHEQIIKSLKGMLPQITAAGAAGICEKTLYNWMDRGIKDLEAEIESPFRNLLQCIKAVEAENQERLLRKIEIGAPGWQGSAWILERRWRALFGVHGDEIRLMMEKLDAMERKLNGDDNGE